MNKCLILAKLKESDEKENVGLWLLVNREDEQDAIKALGAKFIFSFDLNEVDDEVFLKNF